MGYVFIVIIDNEIKAIFEKYKHAQEYVEDVKFMSPYPEKHNFEIRIFPMGAPYDSDYYIDKK